MVEYRLFLLMLILLEFIYEMLNSSKYTAYGIIMQLVIVFMCLGIAIIDILENSTLFACLSVFTLTCYIVALVFNIVGYIKFKKPK